MVEIGGDVFAMPMEAVVEIVSVAQRAEVLRCTAGRWPRCAAGWSPLVRLGDVLTFHSGQRRGSERGPKRRSWRPPRWSCGEPGQEIGLSVDRVIGEEDMVIKSIAENYGNVRGIAGASILGDGRVAMILDIVGPDRRAFREESMRTTC